MKTQITLITVAALLTACSSVSEKIPTVKIEKRKPKTTVQTASYTAPSQVMSYSQPHTKISSTALPKETSTVCETEQMRIKVVDGNDTNDSVRIMVVQDSNGSSELLSEVEINCRDYFLRKSVHGSTPTIIQTSTSYQETQTPAPRIATRSEFTYIVQRGDTVWNIAREHCTTVKAISRLNGLGRGNIIDIGQRLKMPEQHCD